MGNYVALFEKVPGKDSYGVVFPDFPGCVSAGNSYDEAMRNAHEALALHVYGMREDGDDIPASRSLEQIEKTWEDWQEWKRDYEFVVGYVRLLPLKSVKKSVDIMIDAKLLAQIDAVYTNRSSFFSDAARQMLGLL